MKKVMCAKCGGQKMAKGGTMKTTVGKATPKGQIYGIPQTGPTGPNYQGVNTMKKGGKVTTRKKMGMGGMHMMPDGSMMKNSMMKKGGSLKPVPTDKVSSLGKLPTAVRNKMGFQKKGGVVKKK